MNNKFKYILLLFFVSAFGKCFAQQIPLLDQYYINPVVYNPATVGAKGLFNSYLIRNQKFKEFNNGQITHLLTADVAFKDNKFGFGVNLANDDVGIFNNTQALFCYSYRLKISDSHRLRLGVSAGISDFRVNMSEVRANPNDRILINSNIKSSEFMANFGIYYTYKNFFAGITIPQLLNNSIQKSEANKETSYELIRQFIINGGYKFKFPQIKELSISPVILTRYTKNTPVQYDINLLAEWNDKLWFAVSYRDQFSVGFNIGVHFLQNFKFGYSYNAGIQNTSQSTSNNHEFLLGYCINRKTKKVNPIDINSDIISLKNQLGESYTKIDQLKQELEKSERERKNMDQDGDGVPNKEDQCPDTPPFYIVDSNGCPKDSDGDGIVDSEDICPDLAGTIENKGCPDKKEKKNEFNGKLENVYFAFGKYNITNYSKRKLDNLLLLLKSNNMYIVKLHGHTDDIGSAAANRIISLKRLNAVKNYLIEHGITEKRIVVISHGESLPITDNENQKSRANNRRVTFEVFTYQ